MKVLAVIPARGGSKGVPRKNLRTIAGKPLITYIIETALKATTLERVIVSTDDEEIASTALRYGAEVPYVRPSELAGDQVSLIPVVRHALSMMDQTGWKADVVISLQPTSPLTSVEIIDRAVNLLREGECDSVVGLERIEKHHPFRALKLEGGRVLPLTEYTSERYLQRQDRPPAYGLTGALYVRRRELLESWSGNDFCLGRDVRGVLTEGIAGLNIDREIDLLFFEFLMTREGACHEARLVPDLR